LVFQEETTEGQLARHLGNFQSHITASIGLLGRTSGVVLIVAPTHPRWTAAGEVPDPLFSVAGAALAVERRKIAVLRAQHALARCIRETKRMHKGTVQVWAMPAQAFECLDHREKLRVNLLREKGAVLAKAYRSSIKDQWLNHKDNPGMNLAILELTGPLPGMPVGQPHIFSKGEARNIVAYFRKHGLGSRVTILLEGLGSHTSCSSSGRQHSALKVR
jgi:hypothetical protein